MKIISKTTPRGMVDRVQTIIYLRIEKGFRNGVVRSLKARIHFNGGLLMGEYESLVRALDKESDEKKRSELVASINEIKILLERHQMLDDYLD